MAYRIVGITNNVLNYPKHEKDTDEFPHLVEDVEDELSFFVVNEETDEVWPAAEFFMMEDINRFERIE